MNHTCRFVTIPLAWCPCLSSSKHRAGCIDRLVQALKVNHTCRFAIPLAWCPCLSSSTHHAGCIGRLVEALTVNHTCRFDLMGCTKRAEDPHMVMEMYGAIYYNNNYLFIKCPPIPPFSYHISVYMRQSRSTCVFFHTNTVKYWK